MLTMMCSNNAQNLNSRYLYIRGYTKMIKSNRFWNCALFTNHYYYRCQILSFLHSFEYKYFELASQSLTMYTKRSPHIHQRDKQCRCKVREAILHEHFIPESLVPRNGKLTNFRTSLLFSFLSIRPFTTRIKMRFWYMSKSSDDESSKI
jgi:hypothetical protein